MIDLEPIPYEIQKRLFEKMRVLGRDKNNTPNVSKSKGVYYGLTHAKMATRSTFLRMTSGQLNPIILQGGKLASNNALGTQIPAGYDEIYGPRKYLKKSMEDQLDAAELYTMGDFSGYSETQLDDIITTGMRGMSGETVEVNKNKRPMPGVTSIDATFKGGQRALREATISWICYDWEELNILMPHFLAHGKTVMVEWGWVYDAKSIHKLFDFIEQDSVGNTKISATAFTDYRDFIAEKEGDMDMMVGIVKNFEFTTREDGGFNCQTIISSVGASIINTPQPNEAILDPGITYNLSINQDSKEVAEAIEEATGEQDKYASEQGTEQEALIELNTNATLKLFVKNIDLYILEKVIKEGKSAGGQTAYIPNKCLAHIGITEKNYPFDTYFQNLDGYNYYKENPKKIKNILKNKNRKQTDFWVKWGWFEDNILSKFLSVTSNKTYDVLTEFRSINKVTKTEDNPWGYESVRIKNHSELETTDISNHILPGQFYPLPASSAIYIDRDGNEKEMILDGDHNSFHTLRDVINTNFDIFATGNKISEVINRAAIRKEVKESLAPSGVTADIVIDKYTDQAVNIFETEEGGFEKAKKKGFTKEIKTSIPSEEGYLRNILVNTKVLKQAFNVNAGSDNTIAEPTNVLEAIQTMFSLLNQDLNFWSYNLVVDDTEDKRVKIVDEQITAFDFNKPGGNQAQQSVFDGADVKQQDGTPGLGVFYFPVWRKDSMIKTQNVTAKVPDELALTTMYGANMDQLKDFANPGSQFADKSGVALSGLYNNQLDENKKQLDIAFKNNNTKRIGTDTLKPDEETGQSPIIPLRAGGDGPGDDIETFIKTNSKELEESYETRLKSINEMLKTSKEALESDIKYSQGVPAPLPDNLDPYQLGLLIEYEKNRASGQYANTIIDLFSGKFYYTGEMKVPFKRSVGYLTTQHGIYKQANTALLIPLEIELEIDGIGGIYPGNSFHSTYLPQKYKDKTIFQAFDVNHRLDSSGWTTTIAGKMRSTISNIFTGFKDLKALKAEQLENYVGKAYLEEKERLKKQAAYDKVDTSTVSRGPTMGSFR